MPEPSDHRDAPGRPRTARRILIYGVTGAGKTTLARRLGGLTGLPWFEVDQLTWEPGWVPVPPDVQRRRIAEICAADEWILDTAYSQWIDLVLPRAELILALDYPRWRSLGRLLRRTAARNLDRRPICNGNVESLRNTFSRDSIVAWHFRSYRRKRARIRTWAAGPESLGGTVPPVVRAFTRPAELEAWLVHAPALAR